MYSGFVDNGKLAVLTSARRENGFPPKCKTSTGNELDFRSPSPSQKSALLKVPIILLRLFARNFIFGAEANISARAGVRHVIATKFRPG